MMSSPARDLSGDDWEGTLAWRTRLRTPDERKAKDFGKVGSDCVKMVLDGRVSLHLGLTPGPCLFSALVVFLRHRWIVWRERGISTHPPPPHGHSPRAVLRKRLGLQNWSETCDGVTSLLSFARWRKEGTTHSDQFSAERASPGVPFHPSPRVAAVACVSFWPRG